MLNKTLLTPVDELVELVKKNNNCKLSFLKSELKMPSEFIEKWLVVLEENKIVKTHYKSLEAFVEYIEVNEEAGSNLIDIEKIKKVFIEKAKEKHLAYSKISQIWPQFIEENEEEIKKLFENKARSLGYEEKKVISGWNKYKEDLKKL